MDCPKSNMLFHIRCTISNRVMISRIHSNNKMVLFKEHTRFSCPMVVPRLSGNIYLHEIILFFPFATAKRTIFRDFQNMREFLKKIIDFCHNRYTADNDGYRADVSYIIEKNAIESDPHQHTHPHPPPDPRQHHHHHHHHPHQHHQAVENDYTGYVANTAEQQDYHQLNSYNAIYDASSVQSLAQPVPTSSAAVFFTTAQPPPAIDADGNFYGSSALSLEQRKSISARPTYVVSAKSTHITDNHYDHNHYYKPAHPVFYKAT